MTHVDVFICDAVRTPIGRYAGSLSAVRPDDLAALTIRALIARNPQMDVSAIDDLILGCANQAGEDNRNIARMACLLGGLGEQTPGMTINRLCGSGMDAISVAARAVISGECDLLIAGGVESMSRAPFVMPKAESGFSRNNALYDTTIGWRFINAGFRQQYGVDSMPETAENVAAEFNISREDQDKFACESQRKAAVAQKSGRFDAEIIPVEIPQRKAEPIRVTQDEHLRETSLEALARLRPFVRADGTITAGNASGVNDGAAAMIIAGKAAIDRFGLTPRARVLGCATAGVPPRIMGIGPVPASQKLLKRLGMKVSDFDVVELNEAFASQSLAVLRQLGLPDNAAHVNPNGGAIALGHPLGMSGTRLVQTAVEELVQTGANRALCTMCIGVGQGIAMAVERV